MSSVFNSAVGIIGAAVLGAPLVLSFGIGGGALIVAGGLLVYSTIEGIATGRMFSSPMAFLFEPTRAICELLGITNKKVEQGSISVVKIFHENQYPDTLVNNCIIRNKDSSDLLTYFYNFSKIGQAQYDKYYHMGRKRFIDALPSYQILSSTVSFETIESFINKDLGVVSKVRHFDIGYPDYDDWVRYVLQNQQKYEYATSTVTLDNKPYHIINTNYNETTNKIEVYLKGIDGNEHSQMIEIVPPTVTSYIIALYTTTSSDNLRIWIHETDMDSLDVDFTEDDLGKMLKNDLLALPVVCLRNDKIDLIDVNSESNCSDSFKKDKRYTQSKKLLKAIGVSIEELTAEYNKNNNVRKVYDAYFMVGISPAQTQADATKDPEGKEYSIEVIAKYMYEAILFIYKHLPCVLEGQPYFLNYEELPLKGQVVWAGVPPKEVIGKKCRHGHYTLEVGDTATEHYKVIIQQLIKYKGSKQLTHHTYNSEGYETGSNTYTVYEYEAKYFSLELSAKPITPQKILTQLDNAIPFFPNKTTSSKTQKIANNLDASTSYSSETPSFPATVQLKEQIEDPLPVFKILKTTKSREYDSESETYRSTTNYSYDLLTELPQTTALDLEAYVTVWKEPASITLIHQQKTNEYIQIILRSITSIYYTESVGMGLLSTAHADDVNFIFPVSYAALRNLSVYDKTKLFSESFYMLFFAKDVQELEFYQTPEFGTFLQIVGIAITIVVTIFTWGSQTVTTQMVIQGLIKAVVIYVGVTLALQIIALTIPDSTLKAILSATVMVAAIYFGGGFSNFNWGTAAELALVAAKSVDIYTQDQMRYLKQDMVDLQKRYKEAKEAIDKAAGTLTYGIDTQDVIATQANTRAWEGGLLSRDEYYMLALTCPDLYSVCQDQIDMKKSTDLDALYPLYDL